MNNFENFRTGLTRTTYANGYSVSVAFHFGAYADGGKTTAEVAVFDPSGKFYRMDGASDNVIGYCTPDEILAISVKVAAL